MNLFSNYIICLFLSFFFLLIIIKYNVLFRKYHTTRTRTHIYIHIHIHIHIHTHTQKRETTWFCTNSKLGKRIRRRMTTVTSYLCCFLLFSSHQPTHRQEIHWQEKREDNLLYILYLPISFFFIISKSCFVLFLGHITYTSYNDRIKRNEP